jgi:hypothetical protein
MTKKHLQTLFAVSVGLGLVAARSIWPDHIIAVQLVFVSAFVLFVTISGLWRDRHTPSFSLAVVAMILSHCLVLFAAHSMFPFHTIITLLLFACSEWIVLTIIGLKLLRY